MLRIILITLGILFVLFCVLTCYCALVVASREDQRMEKLYLEEEARALAEYEAKKNKKEAVA